MKPPHLNLNYLPSILQTVSIIKLERNIFGFLQMKILLSAFMVLKG